MKKNKKLVEFVQVIKDIDINYTEFIRVFDMLQIEEQLTQKATTTSKRKEISQNVKIIKKEIKELLATGSVDDVKKFLEDTSLNSKKDKENTDKLINITTAHSSKGLEWRCVYIMNAKEEMFPSKKSMDRKEELEEEKRLFYVAVSRAKDYLFISSPEEINSFMSELKYKPYIDLKQGVPRQINKFWN
jgi:superfamily I DNA/RNA helicase